MMNYYDNYLYHHGILGMKWGVRRYQNADGSLTAAGKKRQGQSSDSSSLSKKDTKWVKKNSDKVTEKAAKKTEKVMANYAEELLESSNAVNKNGKLSSATINAYNKKMAELMNKEVSGLSSPSGKTVQFVAKRGEIGVYMALADQGYDMSQVKNGVWDSGRIAYKKTELNKV